MNPEQQAALREPFPAHTIGKLPRSGIQLDYIGHAAVTDRLLRVDPEWSWEPIAFTDDGLPKISLRGQTASMWIRLTVCGVSRLGVGTVQAGKADVEKELISDALRNAAMRFGVALDLWSREELWDTPADAGEVRVEAPSVSRAPAAASAKARGAQPKAPSAGPRDATKPAPGAWQNDLATDGQRKTINRLVDRTGLVPETWPLSDTLTKGEASKLIDWLQGEPADPPAARADNKTDLEAIAERARQQLDAEYAELGEEPF